MPILRLSVKIHQVVAVRAKAVIGRMARHDADLKLRTAFRAENVFMLAHKRRSHGASRNDEHFRQERPEQKRQDQRDRDRFEKLTDRRSKILFGSIFLSGSN